MKVLLIHQAFVTGQEAGGTRHFELGQRLRVHGDELQVIASQVSYLSGERVHPERGGLYYSETVDGLRVLRAFSLPVLHRGFVSRVFAFIVFAVSAVLTGLRVHDIDLVMGTSPPIFQAFSAWLVALIRRRPFLLEIRDLWPEFAIEMGVLRNPLLIALARLGERFLYARANHLLVNSPAYREYLIAKGIPVEKISFVANGVEIGQFDPSLNGISIRQTYQLEAKFLVVYAGAHGPANDLDTVLRTATRLQARSDVHFLMVGDGKDRTRLQTETQRLGLTNITFTGALPKSQMPDVLAASDACLAILMNIPMFTTTYPNKVFDYMAAARPILLAIDGVIRDVVEQSESGIFIPPGDDAALASGIETLLDDANLRATMGTNAREYVIKHFNREQQADEFRDVLLKVKQHQPRRLYRILKRGIDLLVAGLALIVFAPAMLVIAAIIKVKMGSPILFQQIRPGLHGMPFRMIKFRTMKEARDSHGIPLSDANRLTPLGSFLRKTSLDELPELLNVVKGEMSLVGPRPLLMQYLERYTTEQARRHQVLPGVTGWVQINGRNALAWEEKFKLDVWYVEHRSIWLDLKILVLTLWKVIRRQGISHIGESTMPEFLGPSNVSESRDT